MRDPLQRVEIDALKYDDAVLARLGVTDEAALVPPQRAETIRKIDDALKASFPDWEVKHAFTVCCYWSAHYVTSGGELPGFDQVSLWRLVAMCAAGDKDLQPIIHADLRELAKKDSALQDMEHFFASELAGIASAGQVCIRFMDYFGRGGPALLEHVGWLEKTRDQLDEQLRERGRHPVFFFARLLLEPPLVRVKKLVEHGQGQAAIDVIRGVLSVEERATPQVVQLLATASIKVGKQQMEERQFARAWRTFDDALTRVRIIDATFPRTQERQAAIQQLEYLERTAMGELLTDEAKTICDVAKLEIKTKRAISPPTKTELDRAIELLERGASLGSQRAANLISIARSLLSTPPEPPPPPPRQPWWKRMLSR